MSHQIFLLQIVHAEEPYDVVRRGPGGVGGALEVDLRESITRAVLKRGVGVFKTEAVVAKALDEGITEAIMDLKQKTVGL